ncbi:CPBP family intramembrane metalloprotease [Candidatus Bathyarchaeota archaeon]|nr:CPBP family intramembrane metalloprotease [Candidatus Bathyarchaeota archaeon]
MAPLSERAIALLEVCLVTSLTIFIGWILEAYLGWFTFWGWCLKALWATIILLAVIMPKRSFRAYGLLPINSHFTLKWCLIFIAAFILPAAASITLSTVLGVAKPAKLTLPVIILNIIFLMIFIGLIEEAYFRGYVQSRLNEAFKKRWRKIIFKAWNVNYGMGLPLTSIIFALMHIGNYWNPLTSRWEPVWWMPIHLLACFIFGCIAGALRESSGDIYTPASLHGGIMTAYTFLLTYTSELTLNISLFISWFIFFHLLATFFHESKNLEPKAIETKQQK